MKPVDLYGLTLDQITDHVLASGAPALSARWLWRQLYHFGPRTLDELLRHFDGSVGIGHAFARHEFARSSVASPLTLDSSWSTADELSRKFVWRLNDGARIESVSMKYVGRTTACVSSQAGCALGCVFCATGQAGFQRNLSAAEIVLQALHIDHALRTTEASGASRETGHWNPPPSLRDRGIRLRNVVVMGMGEPLLNYNPVMQALAILTDTGGLAISAKRITISTVGIVPGIVRMADEACPYSLAVSLHSTDPDQRLALLPATRQWPLNELMEACRYYAERTRRKIFFEWTMIEDENDSVERARALARLIGNLPAHVNIIPLNKTAGYSGLPALESRMRLFQQALHEHQIPNTIRRYRGQEITAGCGQLTPTEK